MENSITPRSERYTPDSSRSIISTEPFPPFTDETVPLESTHAPRPPPKTFDEMLPNGSNANPKSKLTISDFINPPPFPPKTTSNPFWQESPQRAPSLEPNFQHDQKSLAQIPVVESDSERKQRLELAYKNYTLIQSHAKILEGEIPASKGYAMKWAEKVRKKEKRFENYAREERSGKRKRPWSWKKGDDAEMMRRWRPREKDGGDSGWMEGGNEERGVGGSLWKRVTLKLSGSARKLTERLR